MITRSRETLLQPPSNQKAACDPQEACDILRRPTWFDYIHKHIKNKILYCTFTFSQLDNNNNIQKDYIFIQWPNFLKVFKCGLATKIADETFGDTNFWFSDRFMW